MATLTVRGWIRLPSPQALPDGAIAIVGLDDVGCVDAPSARVAETVVHAISGLRERIPFSLSVDDAALASGDYVLAAEVRRDGKGGLQPGDFLSTVAHPWSPGQRDGVDEIVPVDVI